MRISVQPNGRMFLPAALRRRLGLEEGGHVIAEVEGDTVRLSTPDRDLMEARALFRRHVPEGGPSLVDELIAERRAESAAELAEAQRAEATGEDEPDGTDSAVGDRDPDTDGRSEGGSGAGA